MFRPFYFLSALLISQLAFPQVIEPPTSETVLELYQTHGIPFESGRDRENSDGRSALLILSAACSQCVELTTLYKEELIQLAVEQGFNTRFVEMPGAFAPPEGSEAGSSQQSSLLPIATDAANSASMILECSQPDSGEQALALIGDIGRAARLISGTTPNPDSPLTTDWRNWVYLSAQTNAGQAQSLAADVLQVLVGARDIDMDNCDLDFAWERLRARHGAIFKSGIAAVPGFYLLPNESFPRLMIWDFEDLYELVTDQ